MTNTLLERLETTLGCYSACLEDPQKHMAAISEAIAALKAQAWRSVEDELPEEYEVVRVAGGIAHRVGALWRSLSGCEYPGRPITWEVHHWKYMDAAPAPAPIIPVIDQGDEHGR